MPRSTTPTPRLTGQEWYLQQAIRTLNQAIGRVIRHKNDYGAILLFDERFSQSRVLSMLSRWVRPAIRTISEFEELNGVLNTFFQGHTQRKRMEADRRAAEIGASTRSRGDEPFMIYGTNSSARTARFAINI